MSSMWMHMSPTMPLPYSMNARQPRGWTMRVVRPHRRRAGPHLVIEISRAARCPADCRGRACGNSSKSRPWPILPSLPCVDDLSRASTRCGVLRRCVPTCTTRLCLRAAASIAWPSATSTLIGFWHIDIGAGLDGRDHRQRVPVVRRGDQHDVEVLFLEHLAIVAVGARLLLRRLPLGHHFRGLGEHLLIDVAQRHDLDRRHLDQAEQSHLPYHPVPISPTRRGFRSPAPAT